MSQKYALGSFSLPRSHICGSCPSYSNFYIEEKMRALLVLSQMAFTSMNKYTVHGFEVA